MIGSVLTPARRRGVELLDDPAVAPVLRERSLSAVAVSTRLLAGRRAALAELRARLAEEGARGTVSGRVTLLDVGTGFADIPSDAARVASNDGFTLTTVGVDF